MTQSEAVLLSLLGPRPVFWYEKSVDSYFCSWNGVRMTQEHALMLISELFWGQYPSPEMKRVADRKFYIFYNSGIFENSQGWKGIVESHAPLGGMHSWYKKSLIDHINKELYDYTTLDAKFSEVYNWLDFDRLYQEKSG